MALSANKGVSNSVGFFTGDEFCRICDNCDEYGLIVHICDVSIEFLTFDIFSGIFYM